MAWLKRALMHLELLHANHQAAHWRSVAYTEHDPRDGVDALRLQLFWQRRAQQTRRKLDLTN